MDDFKGDRPSHLFVRFNTVEPGIRGAHVAYANVLIVDGEVLRDEELPPVPLDVDGEDFRALINLAEAQAVAGALRMAVEIEALTDRAKQLEGERDSALAEVVAALEQARLSTANAAVVMAAAEDLADASRARVADLEAELAAIVTYAPPTA